MAGMALIMVLIVWTIASCAPKEGILDHRVVQLKVIVNFVHLEDIQTCIQPQQTKPVLAAQPVNSAKMD
jgi:hypothetical protein